MRFCEVLQGCRILSRTGLREHTRAQHIVIGGNRGFAEQHEIGGMVPQVVGQHITVTALSMILSSALAP